MNLINMNCHWKIEEFNGQPLGKKKRKNATTAKAYILRRSAQKLKNIFSPMTTFYNFTLKIEISWAEKVDKSILKTWNVKDVIAYSWVPNNRPLPIVNFSIFFHPGHLYSNPPPTPFFSTQDLFIPTTPIINFQSFLLTFLSVNSHFPHNPSQRKRNCAV